MDVMRNRSAAGDDAPGTTMPELSADECYRLLSTQQLGCLGVNAEHYPLIIPVNYGMDGGTVVIRTHPGTTLRAASHANVTFEVDDVDPRSRSGSSVLVRGLAEEVGAGDRAGLVARTQATDVEPWAPGEYGSWLRIIVHHITGRRIVPGELPPAVDPRAYL
jgi:nitroimidazol reductase NimA-like FMN-containing flavoprotein (pyridoxamine 5'-phosphate oxidase superfamily)